MSDTYSTPTPADTGGGGGGDVGGSQQTADIVVTDRQLFDDAITPPEPVQRSEPRPTPQQPPQTPQMQPPQQRQQPAPQQQQLHPGEQPRNELGQFAPRPQQQQPQQQPPQGGNGAAQQPGQQQHQVPLRELLDERERRYRLQAEADQMRRAWNDLHARAQQLQQPQVPQTIYDNPEEYLRYNVMDVLRNEGNMAIMQMRDGMSREFANGQFGEQEVNAALHAMAQVRHTPDGDHQFRQIMASGHPYGHLVRWFRNMRAQQQIGPDPAAWMQRQREAWLNDPAVQAEVMRRFQQQRQQQQPGLSPQGGPNVQLPPSLSSLPASSGNREPNGGDMSDASLFAFATR